LPTKQSNTGNNTNTSRWITTIKFEKLSVPLQADTGNYASVPIIFVRGNLKPF
jgi:hypothetical protein